MVFFSVGIICNYKNQKNMSEAINNKSSSTTNDIILRSSLELTVREILYKGVSENAKKKLIGLSLDDSLKDKGQVDSLEAIELIMQIEDYVSIEISDELAETLLTIGLIVDYLLSVLEVETIINLHSNFSDDFFDILTRNLGEKCALEDKMRAEKKLILES